MILCYARSFTQVDTTTDNTIYIIVEEMPIFPGGEQAMMKFLVDHLKYPEFERDNCIQGTVIVQFIVEKDGSVSNVQVIKGISSGLNDESVRVVKNFPKWEPARQKRNPVRIVMNLPIKFKIEDCVPMNTDIYDTIVYDKSSPMPGFPGGPVMLNKYLKENLKYPKTENKNGVKGTVVLGFVVEKNGVLNNIVIEKGVTSDINAEAIRLVKEMPLWSPGKINGKIVRVKTLLEIEFK